MPAYNFQERFAGAVESGQKLQTIRKTDKGARPGSKAYLYTGQRTVHCRLLGMGTVTDVFPVHLGRFVEFGYMPFAEVADINGGKYRMITGASLDAFARDDGFQSTEEMFYWFQKQHGLPFYGFLHKWSLIK